MPASEPPAGGPPADGPRWGSPGDGPPPAGPPPSGQWASPPGPPRQRERGRGCLWGCVGALAVVIVIVIALVVLVIAQGDDEAAKPAPSRATAEEAQQSHGERADLVSFQLDDRSAAGITDIWVTWTIKNSSSRKSDYSWDWEAVDADGTRLENGSALETDVRPGQTVRGEFFTTLDTMDGVTLNITRFERTASG